LVAGGALLTCDFPEINGLRHNCGHVAMTARPPLDARRAVLDLIGNTPLLPVQRLDTGPCELFLKLESQNPGGSIKDGPTTRTWRPAWCARSPAP